MNEMSQKGLGNGVLGVDNYKFNMVYVSVPCRDPAYGQYAPSDVPCGQYAPNGVPYGQYASESVHGGQYAPEGVSCGQYSP